MSKEQVNHPERYNKFSVEVIDMMERVFGKEKTAVFCELNAFKYQMRAGFKDCAETDLAKRDWYLRKVKELEGGPMANDTPNEQPDFDPKSGEDVLVWYKERVWIGKWVKDHLPRYWDLANPRDPANVVATKTIDAAAPIPKPAVYFGGEDKPEEQPDFDPKSGEDVLVWLHNGEVSVGRWDKECHLWSLMQNGGITFRSDSDAGEVTQIPKPAVSFLERKLQTRRPSRICRL